MPHVTFNKQQFLEEIEEPKYTDEQIIELFAKLGMESEVKDNVDGISEIELEFMANRYDLSGLDGVALEVRCFLGKDSPLILTPKPPTIKFFVDPSAECIRPFAIGAILRGITFTPELFQRFIDLQEKLHDNACRKRALVAIGTHDLSTLTPPFYYRGEEPTFEFVPLHTTLVGPAPNDVMPELLLRSASDWFNYYDEKKLPLSKYTGLINKSKVVPVIRDAKGVLMSLPPLVNGEHSKCTLETRDIFIDMTGVDLTRMTAVMNVILASFAKFCSGGIEHVEVVSSHPAYSNVLSTRTPCTSTPSSSSTSSSSSSEQKQSVYPFPRAAPIEIPLRLSYVNSLLGLSLTADEAIALLRRKQVIATVDPASPADDVLFKTTVPCHRSDAMHESDLAEDILIAYGIERIEADALARGVSGRGRGPVGTPLLAEEAVDGVRSMAAFGGYVEMYNFVLLALDDNCTKMRRPVCVCSQQPFQYSYPTPLLSAPSSSSSSPSSSSLVPASQSLCRCGVVSTLNGKTLDTGSVRTSLLPCILHSLRFNNHHPKPVCLFEVGDVVFPDVAGCGGTRCGKKRIPCNQRQLKCDGICGGGCCAKAKVTLIAKDGCCEGKVGCTSSTDPMAWRDAVAFEVPSLNGTIPSDCGARNERHFSAVRCGPDVAVESIIPIIARVFHHCRCLFVDDAIDPVAAIEEMKVRLRRERELESVSKEEKEKDEGATEEKENEKKDKLRFVPALWQMLPISRVLASIASSPSSVPSSTQRWLTDSYSFVKGNAAVICLTDLGDVDETHTTPLVQIPIGVMGVVRPDILKDFSVHHVTVAVEINIEPLVERLL